MLVGSLDGLPELAPFRVGFFRAPPRLLGRLRSLKQAVSICTAAPSQRTAALLLGAAPAKPGPRPVLAKPGKDDSRYSLMELAASLDGVVSLGRGDPDADAPESVLEAACARIGETEPLDPLGQRWLRERIVEREEARTGVRWDPDTETLVTGGAQEGIALAMLALVGEREEVLLADPRYTSYEQAIALARGRMAPVPCGGNCGGRNGDGHEDFGMRAAATEEALRQTERPRLLAIVNFSNPTGARTRAGEVEDLCGMADRHHLWVLSDEVYADMALDGEGPVLSPSTLPGMRNRTLTMGSVSKSYAMTGFRIGYLTGPADAIAACARAKAALSGPSPLFSQRAAAAALAGGEAFPARLRESTPRGGACSSTGSPGSASRPPCTGAASSSGRTFPGSAFQQNPSAAASSPRRGCSCSRGPRSGSAGTVTRGSPCSSRKIRSGKPSRGWRHSAAELRQSKKVTGRVQ